MAEGAMDRFAEGLLETFRWSFEQQSSDFGRMESLSKTYDNKVNKEMWSTISQIPLATAWATVERSVSSSTEYLYPPQPVTRLLPMEKVDDDSIHRMEWALHVMMKYRMGMRKETFKAVKDTFKIGIGYNIIEPFTITPPASYLVTAGDNETRRMGPGVPVQALRCRYVSAGKIVAYPSGTDFNGTDATPIAFFMDLYYEDDFKEMFGTLPKDGDSTKLMGNADEIIAEARANGINSQTTIKSYIESLGGRKVVTRRSGDDRIPVMVPILKCYQHSRETWITCMATNRTIFDVKGTLGTMRKPLIKWDAWTDSDRWYPMSQPEADERTSWAKNLWFNGMFDLMTYALNRPLLWDNSSGNRPPQFGMNGQIGLPGDVTRTAKFLDAPGIDQGTLAVGAQIDAIRGDVTGQRDLTQRNFNRGGSQAFQELVQSTTGQEYIRNVLLQMSGLENAAEQVLIYMQQFGDKLDLNFQRPSRTDGERTVEYFQVTEDDLQHGYSLSLDLESQRRKGGMDLQNKLAVYDRKIANPAFDDYEVSWDICMDDEEAQRQVFSKAIVREKQAQREAAEQQALAQQGAPAGPAPAEIGAQA